MIWQATQDFPSDVKISEVTIVEQNAVGETTSPFSFKRNVFVWQGQRWSMQVIFRPSGPIEGSKLEAFIASLNGTAGTFRFGDPAHSAPMGWARGLPRVESANANEQSVVTRGWTPQVAYQLRAGDYIQLGDRLHKVLSDVHSDSNGEATLSVWPNLRETHAAGTEVITENPTGIFRLANPNAYRRTAALNGHRHITQISIIEEL